MKATVKYNEKEEDASLFEETLLPKDIDEEDTSDANDYIKSIVPSTDDPATPSLTFRVIFLGTLWNILLSTANSIFQLRTNTFTVNATVAVLLSYPMGIFMATVIPRGYFNPGPFSVKEHVLVYIIANAGAGLAYGVDNVVVQKYKEFMGNPDINFWNSICFVLSVQLIGFGMAGVLRRFLVKPMGMFWPTILSQVALFVGFHEHVYENQVQSRYKLSRFHFFMIVAAGMFVWTWLPEYFVSTLSAISLVCFFTTNSKVKFLASADSSLGVGLGSLSLNWSYMTSFTPLTTPFYASLQFFLSTVIWSWIVVPILFYSNAFQGDQLLNRPDAFGGPTLNNPYLYNKYGTKIRPATLFDRTNSFNLNQTAYDAQSPLYITTSFAVTYGQSFMSIAAAIIHVLVWYGPKIWKQFKSALKQQDDETDIHNRLMKAYPDIPEWMYLAFLVLMILVQILVSVFTPFKMPIWSVFLCLFLVLIFLLPIGVITAVTGVSLGLNVLTEFIIGLMIPGETVAVMAFKSLGTNSIVQAIFLIADLKLGHYMKINPVHMVIAQFYGTVFGAILNCWISIWAEELLSHLLFINDDWKVNGYSTFMSAGAIWGAIGPQRFFGVGSIYEGLLWFFLAGALLPLLPWILNKIYPCKLWHYINIPVLCSGVANPGNVQSYPIVTFFIAWLFQSYIFKHYREWWDKYDYILATALDSGNGIAQLIITIVQQLGIAAPIWSGNPNTYKDYYCIPEAGYYAPP